MNQYPIYLILNEITKKNDVTLQSMALVQDISYVLKEEYDLELTEELFYKLYDEILRYEVSFNYGELMLNLIDCCVKEYKLEE